MDKKPVPFAELKNVILKKINKNMAKALPGKRFFRFEFRTEMVDPLLWLKVQPNREKIYFESRSIEEPLVAAAGCSYQIIPDPGEDLTSYFKRLNNILSDGIRLYGGVSFCKDIPAASEWESFGSFKFILPRFEYIRRDNKAYFAINILNSELTGDEINRVINEVENIILAVPEKYEKSGKCSFIKFTPDREGWIATISSYLEKIKKGKIEKIVAARRMELSNSGNVDPFKVVSDLKRTGDFAAHFLLTFNGEDYFAGSTPERLFHRDGELLTTESVAGTAKRGSDKAKDKSYGDQLLDSKKEKLEHDFVTNDIVNKLHPICEPIAISERVLLKLSNLQHLYRRISGKLKKGITDGEILDKLFPTPAVSGLPLKKSLEILQKEEQFPRGWYAGIVGFAGKDISDYYVGIRSMLINSKKIYVYSGAGIVKGSDPEREWEEIDLKIKKYKKILKYEN